MKRLSDRAFAKGDAPTMAWCVPGVIRITCMLHQRPKERWQQTVQIASGRPSDLPRGSPDNIGATLARVAELMDKNEDVLS